MAIQYNVTLHDGATNNNGIVTDLGYAEINNVIDFASASSWEIQIKVIGGYGDPAYVIGGMDSSCGILINFSDNYYKPILIDSNGNYIGGADGTRYGAYSSSSSECILTLKFTGTQYEFYKDSNLSATIESDTSVKSFNSPLCLGNNYNGGSFDSHVQQIDLNGCYIKVDGANAWSGVSQGYNGIHIQLRRDTLANWTSANPTLYDGEVGLITDQAKYVVGDGTSTFTSLTKHNMDTDISNLADKDLGNLSATGQAIIDGKANINLSNITQTALNTLSKVSLPSSVYVDMTPSTSGAIYTMPADGWLCLGFQHPDTADWVNYGVDILNSSNQFIWNIQGTRNLNNQTDGVVVPVLASQKVQIWSNSYTIYRMRFIYAEGSWNLGV